MYFLALLSGARPAPAYFLISGPPAAPNVSLYRERDLEAYREKLNSVPLGTLSLELEQLVGVVLRISVALSCRLAVEKRAQVLPFMRAAAGEENFALGARSGASQRRHFSAPVRRR